MGFSEQGATLLKTMRINMARRKARRENYFTQEVNVDTALYQNAIKDKAVLAQEMAKARAKAEFESNRQRRAQIVSLCIALFVLAILYLFWRSIDHLG